MPGFIEHRFLVLVLVVLSLGRSLAINCLCINNQPCMFRPMLIDLNPDELHYYPLKTKIKNWMPQTYPCSLCKV